MMFDKYEEPYLSGLVDGYDCSERRSKEYAKKLCSELAITIVDNLTAAYDRYKVNGRHNQHRRC